MKGISKVSLATLLSPDNLKFEHEYVGRLSFSSESFKKIRFLSEHLKPFTTNILFVLGEYTVAEIKQDGDGLFVKIDTGLANAYRQIINRLHIFNEAYVRLISKCLDPKLKLTDKLVEEKAAEFERAVLKQCKVTKRGTTTLKNWIVGYAKVLGLDLPQAELKNILTIANASEERWYLYSTNNYYAQHYAKLSESEHIITCMTKSDYEYDHSAHYVAADSELAEKAGYPVDENGAVFTAPIECWNHSTGVKLFLLSKIPPQEIATQSKYPFVARAIVGTSSEIPYMVKLYGNEKAHTVFENFFKKQRRYSDVQVRAYCVSSGELTEFDDYYILPYIDGDSNVWAIDTQNKHIDEIGRAYCNATLVHMHRDDDVRETKLDKSQWVNLYTCSQNNWVSVPVRFTARCDILGVSFLSTQLVYSPERNAFIFKDLQGKSFSGELLDIVRSITSKYSQDSAASERADYYARRARRVESQYNGLLNVLNMYSTTFNFGQMLSPLDKIVYDGRESYLTDIVWGLSGTIVDPASLEELVRCSIRITFFNDYQRLQSNQAFLDANLTMFDVLKVWVEQDNIFLSSAREQDVLHNVLQSIKSSIIRLERPQNTSKQADNKVFVDIEEFFRKHYVSLYNR